MGVFDAHCAASGLVLDGRTRLLFVLDDDGGNTTPLLPPLRGDYDRYGKIENEAPGPALAAAAGLATIYLGRADLAALIDDAFEPGVPYKEATLRYALIDDLVYRAVVSTVASGGLVGVGVDLEARLTSLPFDELVREATGDDADILKLLEPMRSDEWLRHELVMLALFRQLKLVLHPTTPDSPSGQYLYFHEAVAKEHDEPAVESETQKAEERFAAYPLILAAIDENRRVWVERERSNIDA